MRLRRLLMISRTIATQATPASAQLHIGPIDASGPLPPISLKVLSIGATVTPLAIRKAEPLKAISPPSVTMKLGICP